MISSVAGATDLQLLIDKRVHVERWQLADVQLVMRVNMKGVSTEGSSETANTSTGGCALHLSQKAVYVCLRQKATSFGRTVKGQVSPSVLDGRQTSTDWPLVDCRTQ